MSNGYEPALMAYNSQNDVRIRGSVKDVLVSEEFVILTVVTNKEVKFRSYPCDHMVKVRRENTAYQEACECKHEDIVAIKGEMHPDKSIVPLVFFKEPFFMSHLSENDIRLRGLVKDVVVSEEFVILTIVTAKHVDGQFDTCPHTVKVRRENRAYHEGSECKREDIVELNGAIHPDKSIVPFRVFNETARRKGRLSSLSDAATIAQRRKPS